MKKNSNTSMAKIVENLLGRGICSLCCKYDETYFCNAEKGSFADTEGEVFAIWKSKLKKHEEKNTLMASYTYRNEKRLEKQRQKEI